MIRDFRVDVAGYDPVAVWTAWEGRPSADGRYRTLMAEDDRWLPTAFLVYDAATDGTTVLDLRGVCRP